jgi:hypothetical protein
MVMIQKEWYSVADWLWIGVRDFKEMWLWILYVIGGMGTMNKYELSSRVSGRI